MVTIRNYLDAKINSMAVDDFIFNFDNLKMIHFIRCTFYNIYGVSSTANWIDPNNNWFYAELLQVNLADLFP